MSYYHGPKIVSSNLIACLDAANPKSYPGSGTSWYDLNTKVAGSLTGSPTFSTSGLGSISFDNSGTQYGTIAHSTFANIANNNSFSVTVAFYYAGGTDKFVLCNGGFSAGGYWMFISSALKCWVLNSAGSTQEVTINNFSSVYTNTWVIVTHRFSWGGKMETFLNGLRVSTVNVSGTAPSAGFSNMNIASPFGAGDVQNLYGKIGYIVAHSKALSDQEIQQNYHALKRRYGLL